MLSLWVIQLLEIVWIILEYRVPLFDMILIIVINDKFLRLSNNIKIFGCFRETLSFDQLIHLISMWFNNLGGLIFEVFYLFLNNWWSQVISDTILRLFNLSFRLLNQLILSRQRWNILNDIKLLRNWRICNRFKGICWCSTSFCFWNDVTWL